jgi:amphi-Trp domain-containing protein
MSKNEVSMKQKMPLEKAVDYLREFATSMKIGKIYVQKEDDHVELTPRTNVFVEVKAKQKGDREKFTLSVSWENESIETDETDLSISSERPEEEEAEQAD